MNCEMNFAVKQENMDYDVKTTPMVAASNNNPCDGVGVGNDQSARRPMNAFLIFCKRHRSIVRDRYPNLENRAITKILGDWWATLKDEEKGRFTALAKTYKDHFFKANPDFKWYKLPAPSTRTICGSTRSYSESDERRERLSSVSSCASLPAGVPTANTRYSYGSDVGVFKLADETQMGGLSSLMISDSKVENNNDQFHANNNMEICDDKDSAELHRVLGETRSFFQKHGEDGDSDIFGDEMTDIPHSDDFDSIDDDVIVAAGGNAKQPRTCKGKRYEAFMNEQRTLPPIKRFKSRTTSSSSTGSSSSLSPAQPLHDVQKPYPFDHLYANDMVLPQPLASTIETKASPIDEHKPNADEHKSNVGEHKPSFDEKPDVDEKPNVDHFDLELKIQALNAHDLDEYLSRKQTNKRKKSRMPVKKKTSKAAAVKKELAAAVSPSVASEAGPVASPVPLASSVLASNTASVKVELPAVGSQKRKPRKKSVSRLNMIASIHGITTPFAGFNTFANVIGPSDSKFAGSGLLMLAEVAAANFAI